jgi:hypothetical protein
MRNKPDFRPQVDESFDLELAEVVYDPTRKTKPAITRSIVGRGAYFAIGGRVTAFVMLDEHDPPPSLREAANDAQ